MNLKAFSRSLGQSLAEELLRLDQLESVEEDFSLKPTNRATEQTRDTPNHFSSSHRTPDLDPRFKWNPKNMKRVMDSLKTRKPYDRITSTDEVAAIKRRKKRPTA